jgi:hypothetical protein
LAVSAALPPTLRELVFDAANLCTILAMLFDLYAISATLKDRNYHLAIALGQMSAMCVPVSLDCKAMHIFNHPILPVVIGSTATSPAIFWRLEDPSSYALSERSLIQVHPVRIIPAVHDAHARNNVLTQCSWTQWST